MTVRIEKDGSMWTVIHDRPEARNAMDPKRADALTAAVSPTGPYMIKGAKLPDSVLPAGKDLAAYIDAGKSGPALEFVSPIKGPSLEQICVAVGTGQMDAATAAAEYDEDVKKQAQQLGIPGWE